MPTTYAIVEATPDSAVGFSPRGAAARLWRCKDHEVFLSGPAETGKTFACCQKLDALLWNYPRSQAVVIRKTLATVFTTVLQTYRAVIGPNSPIVPYGGAKPEWFDYPNGSRLFVAGMDNAGKALSSERDFIYINQAEELTLGDYETLTTRCTGRAGNAPYPQIMGDCNPGAPQHWIKHRPSLTLIESKHEDNPVLFDESGAITVQGKFSLAVLDALTGVRKARLRHGLWVAAEGTVYADEWSEERNLVAFAGRSSYRRCVVSIDWGYTNAGVMLVWDVDGDGRMTLVREYYRTGQLIGWWVDRAKEVRVEYRPETFVCDPSRPEHIQEFVNAGLPAQGAFNDIERGIQAVKERLLPAGDGRPRLTIARDSNRDRDSSLASMRMPTSVVDEFTLYVYPKGQDGRPLKELPVDADNHGLDALRYAVAYVDGLGHGRPGVPLAGGSRPSLYAAPARPAVGGGYGNGTGGWR
jgi:phage terminase large subunit